MGKEHTRYDGDLSQCKKLSKLEQVSIHDYCNRFSIATLLLWNRVANPQHACASRGVRILGLCVYVIQRQ